MLAARWCCAAVECSCQRATMLTVTMLTNMNVSTNPPNTCNHISLKTTYVNLFMAIRKFRELMSNFGQNPSNTVVSGQLQMLTCGEATEKFGNPRLSFLIISVLTLCLKHVKATFSFVAASMATNKYQWSYKIQKKKHKKNIWEQWMHLSFFFQIWRGLINTKKVRSLILK